jgi:hypothetical protein
VATTTAADSARAQSLRQSLVKELLAAGSITSPEVEAAFRAVPRHLFAPEAALEQAYADDIVRTKRDEHGVTVSSVSAPWLQAVMLEQAQIRPGMRCLEIGFGGFNAALMAELVGPDGEVTTVDIDGDVTDRARRFLDRAVTDGSTWCSPTPRAAYRSMHRTAGSSSRLASGCTASLVRPTLGRRPDRRAVTDARAEPLTGAGPRWRPPRQCGA